MRLTTDFDGNTSFGDEMILRADGKPTHCRNCGKALGPLESKIAAKLCGDCVEKRPTESTRDSK